MTDSGELLMFGARSTAALVVGLMLAAWASPARADDPPATASTAHRAVHKKKTAPPPPLVLPPLPAGPLSQVPMDQIPATAPKVTYQNGLLTILAQNATLGEILKQVKSLTGAAIELPANGAPERVVTEIGPGAPRDVLAALLNGTQFNYVMLGSTADPTAIASITLTSKPGSGEQASPNPYPQNAQAMAPMAVSPMQPFRQQVIAAAPPQPEATADAEDNTGDEDDSSNSTDDAEEAQPGQPGQPSGAQPDQPANPNQPNAGPRTPEQLLQMMRQGPQGQNPLPGQIPAPQPPQ